ncbi:cadmium translocating P-type ATPase CadA, putative [Staphylococcus aureus]|nr:cadmium translocating P-type ATPase CadA, putative [Staphylococcus aureus]
MVTDFEVLNDKWKEKELFSIITALEYRSQHPLASAIMKKAEQDNIPYSNVQVEEFTSITGARYKRDCKRNYLLYWSPKLFKELNVSDFSLGFENNVKILQNQGKTAMIIGTEKTNSRRNCPLQMRFVKQVKM